MELETDSDFAIYDDWEIHQRMLKLPVLGWQGSPVSVTFPRNIDQTASRR